jgi:phasin
MNTTTKNAFSQPDNSPMTATPQAFREMAEKGTTQAKENYEKMSGAATEAADFINNACSVAAKGGQEYNAKVIEFARTNTLAAFDFASQLSGVKSPSDFIELSTKHARKQFEALTDQAKELAALAQQVTIKTTEPITAGVGKAFNRAV